MEKRIRSGGIAAFQPSRVAEREAVRGQLFADPRAAEEGDVEPRVEPGAADIAADRAGAVDDDLSSASAPIRRDALVGQPSPSGGAPVCQKTSIGMPPRGYQ